MPRQGFSPIDRRDSRARARAIYEGIKAKLEPSFKGKILAIEVESGKRFIRETALEAEMKARAKHPIKPSVSSASASPPSMSIEDHCTVAVASRWTTNANRSENRGASFFLCLP